MKIIHRSGITPTARGRDAGLRRLSRANRWLIAGSAVLTGVLTDVAANAFPGRTLHRASTTGAGSKAHRHHKPLAPPAQPPSSTPPTQEAAPQAAPAEAPRAETQPSPEPAPAPANEAAPAPAPAEEAPKPEVHEAAPRAEEPAEPVVSGGS